MRVYARSFSRAVAAATGHVIAPLNNHSARNSGCKQNPSIISEPGSHLRHAQLICGTVFGVTHAFILYLTVFDIKKARQEGARMFNSLCRHQHEVV